VQARRISSGSLPTPAGLLLARGAGIMVRMTSTNRDLTALGAAVGELLKQRKETLAIAESSAGGIINAALVAVPGASAYYLGGCIVYTAASRTGLLAISKEDMAGMRSASEPYAQLVARRVREKLGATWGLAETGAAGPTGNRYGDAAGHACFAVSGPVEMVITLETGSADREANMWTFARRAIELLRESLTKA
jgi:PncC family amidohydrolase